MRLIKYLIIIREFFSIDLLSIDLGIEIKEIKDPSEVQEWKQFRYDLITNRLNRLAKVVHAEGKVLNAAVFPSPSIAKKLVRQEWNKWDLDAIYPMNYNDFYLKGPEWVSDNQGRSYGPKQFKTSS